MATHPAAPANALTEWSRALLDGFAAAGVRDVVISPGSRSTPLVVAAARDARLRCVDLPDERAAAFFALGQARVSGRPSLLLCTSGSAGAHYLPAIVESRAAGLPLLVLTADRPFELQDCGASQTIDQTRLFGDQARGFVELGEVQTSDEALRALRRKAVQAALRSRWPQPGAVHLNARARKPLEPPLETGRPEAELESRVDRLLAEPPTWVEPPTAVAAEEPIDRAVDCLSRRRVAIVAGPAALRQQRLRPLIEQLASTTGAAVVAEVTSQLGGGGDSGLVTALESALARHRLQPEVVLQIGAPPVSAGVQRMIAERPPDCSLVVFTEGAWLDPTSSADVLVLGDLADSLGRLAEQITAPASSGAESWHRTRWQLAEAGAAAAKLASASPDDVPSEGGAARALVEELPPGALLGVGNSLPIRLVELFAVARSDLPVWHQRGASGIDGLLAGFCGSLCHGAPDGGSWPAAALLIGDVSTLHDLSSLRLLAQFADLPLVVVVINNQGGRIFEQLPVAERADDELMRHFTTPHALDFSALAEGFDLRTARVEQASDLASALRSSLQISAASLIEVISAPGRAREEKRRLLAAIDGQLGLEESR